MSNVDHDNDTGLAEFMAGCVFSPIGEENGRSV